MNDIILENLIRLFSNKKKYKTIALALFNNLNEDERQKINVEISTLKQANLEFAENFILI